MPELPSGEPRRRLLRRYGELVASLGGSYRTAGDMNISPEDLDLLYVTDDLEEAVQDVVGSYGSRSAEVPTEAKKADAQ